MSALPREARDGLMRAWLEILRERYPGVTWVPAERERAAPAPDRADAASAQASTTTSAHDLAGSA